MSDTPELGALRVETRSDEESGIVVALAGELDLSTVSRFVNAIDDALDDRPPALELEHLGIGTWAEIGDQQAAAHATAPAAPARRACVPSPIASAMHGRTSSW